MRYLPFIQGILTSFKVEHGAFYFIQPDNNRRSTLLIKYSELSPNELAFYTRDVYGSWKFVGSVEYQMEGE